jgi:predicted amidohydrolase YtcJ
MANDNQKRPGFSRRDFIKSAAVTAGGMVLGGAAADDATAAEVTVLGNAPGPFGKGPSVCDGSQDLALINGKFLTLDDKNSVVSAVAIRNGRIAEVGRHAQAIGPCEQTINLRGATVIPGLIDSHVHYLRAGTNPGHEVRIIETAISILELQQMISDRARTVPDGEFITCVGGWNRNGFAERRLPTPGEIDDAAPRNPVYLSETSGGNAAVTNTSGIAFFQSQGVNVNSMTGTLTPGQGLAALQAVQTEEDKQRGTAEVMDFASSLGVTMVNELGQGIFSLDPLESQYRYGLNLWRQGKLKVRHRLRLTTSADPGISAMQTRIVNNFNRLGDDIWRLNGVGESFGDRTGPLFFDACKFVAANGWSMHTHSLTAEENNAHVAGYQAANAEYPIRDLRWSLAHVNIITANLVQALADMGVGVTAEGWRYTTPAGATPLGPPWRMLVDAGLHVGGGTDGTNVGPFNPWLILFYMSTGRNNGGDLVNPGQSVSRLEALKIYTKGSAYHSFDEDKLGTIETGKFADLVVLSDDPLRVSDDKLRKISSVLTLQAGKIVHEAGGRSRGRN